MVDIFLEYFFLSFSIQMTHFYSFDLTLQILEGGGLFTM